MFGAHIPEVQLSPAVIRAALQLADVQPSEKYLEPGSGEGVGLVIAANEFSADATGIEILDHANDIARAAAKSAGVVVQIVRADLQTYSMADADVVLIHLGPAFHDVLADKLQSELKPSTRVVACGWSVAGWNEVDSIEIDGMPVFLYKPADQSTHIRWNEAAMLATPNTAYCLAEVGANLEPVSVQVSNDNVQTTTWPTAPKRGQRMLVEVNWCGVATPISIRIVSEGKLRGTELSLSQPTA